MGLFLKSNGYYYAEITINNKRVQKSLRTKSKVFAQDLYHVLLREQILQSFFPSSSNNTFIRSSEITDTTKKERLSVEKTYLEYLRYSESQGHGYCVMEDKKRLLKRLKVHHLTSFAHITVKKVDQLWVEISKDMKEASLRKMIVSFKSFLNWCIKQGYYTNEELVKLNFPKIQTKVRDKTYTPNQWQDIQERSKKDRDLHLYLKVLYYTGCRPNEIVNLRRQDIDNDGTIKIYQSKVKKYKYVSVPPMILDELLTFQDKIFEGFDKQIEFYSKKFREIKVAMGLNTEYTLYTFRHTFATNLLNKTSDIHLVSKALGHSNIMITSKHYANRSNKDIQDRVSVLWDET